MAKRKYNKRPIDGRYYNYFDICVMEGIPKSRAKNAVSDKKVEGIKSLPELAPIEHLFEVFEKPIKGRMVNSYGILRRYYDAWKQTGEVPKKSPGRPKKDGIVPFKVHIPETIREEFKAVVDKANSMSAIQVTYSDMVAVAMREFIERRPLFKVDNDNS